MDVSTVPIEMIDPPNPILRRFSENSVQFLELVDQIKSCGGALQAPPARPVERGRVQLCDGYRRYRATIKAGLSHMNLVIQEMDDVEYLANQMLCNSMHEETDWIDYAKHLDRLRHLNNTEMTLRDLAGYCSRSTQWVRQVLNLNHLHPHFAKMVKNNEVPIGNAKMLARLPLSEQVHFIDDAQTMGSMEFVRVVRRAINDYREGIKQGRLLKLGKDNFRPVMRDLRVVEEELRSPSHLPALIVAAGITNVAEAAQLALQWAFRVDPKTLAERQESVHANEVQHLQDTEYRKHARKLIQFAEESQTRSCPKGEL